MGFAGTAVSLKAGSSNQRRRPRKLTRRTWGCTTSASHFERFERKKFEFRPEDGSFSPLNFCRGYRSDNLSLDSRPAPDSRVISTGSDLANCGSVWSYLRNTAAYRLSVVRADNASASRALCVPASAPLQILRGRQNRRAAVRSHGPRGLVLMRSKHESLSSAALFCLQKLSRARNWVFRSMCNVAHPRRKSVVNHHCCRQNKFNDSAFVTKFESYRFRAPNLPMIRRHRIANDGSPDLPKIRKIFPDSPENLFFDVSSANHKIRELPHFLDPMCQ